MERDRDKEAVEVSCLASVCVSLCTVERESASEKERGRESGRDGEEYGEGGRGIVRGREGSWSCLASVFMSLSMIERERERERKRGRERPWR